MRAVFNHLYQGNYPDEDTRIRGRNVTSMGLILVGLAILALPFMILTQKSLVSVLLVLIPMVFDISIMFLVRRQYISVDLGASLLLISVSIGLLSAIYIIHDYSIIPFFLILPLMFAGLTLRPQGLWVVLASLLIGLWVVLGIIPTGPLYGGGYMVNVITANMFVVMITLMIFLGIRNSSQARTRAQQQQHVAEKVMRELAIANSTLEQNVAEQSSALQHSLDSIQERERALTQTIEELRTSQDTIQRLSAPVVPILPHVIVAPVIGNLNHERAQLLMENVLSSIKEQRIRIIILDITGVPIVDTQVAHTIAKTARAAQIMGARTILVGIRPEVAQVLVSLDADFKDMKVFADLQQAIALLPKTWFT